jgi:hypothetical protein
MSVDPFIAFVKVKIREFLKKVPLAKSKVECEWRQGLQQVQLFADHFAASSHNNSQVHFSQSSSLSCKGASNSLSWTILRATLLL